MLLLASIKSFGQVADLDTISTWGYEMNPHEPYMESFCTGSIASKSGAYQSIRAKKDASNNPRYRFTLGREVYHSVADAESMVKEILQPLRRTSKHSKLCNMRKAFNIAEVVYFVHSDVNYPNKKIESIMGKLHDYCSSS
jgi:hypothetical protein